VDGEPPIGCFDVQGGALGQDDFEFGYYTVYAYDDLENRNPGLNGTRFGGIAIQRACQSDDDCEAPQHCGTTMSCMPRVPSCAVEPEDCPALSFAPVVDPSTLDRAVTANLVETDAPWETFWVSYYATAGRFDKDTRMVHDPYGGWSDDVAGVWRATGAAGSEVRLWAVLRDNRNGVSWAYQDVFVE
jgi:hypothetical protein